MAKVLIIDDEQRMLNLIGLFIEPYGYDNDQAVNAKVARTFLAKNKYDIILLDIMMPETDGFELCQEIRQTSDIPIIMLTARDQKEDVVKGLRVGADDYITKPFDEQELIARIEALLRRVPSQQTIEVEGLVWDEHRYTLTYRGQHIKVTPKEFMMVGHLMQHPGRVYAREQLIELLWGFDSNTEGRTIDSHVRNIRDKIRQTGFPIDDYFQTVWGIGYKWVLNQSN